MATLVLAGLVLLMALTGGDQVPTVTAVPALVENLTAAVASNGKIEPIIPHTLRAQFATFVERVHVREGQAVSRGQPLLDLEAEEARAELARAREALLAAEDQLRIAQMGGPPEELARLEGDLRKTEAEVVRLRREREALRRLAEKQAATADEVERTHVALTRAEADWQRLQKEQSELTRRAQSDLERARLQRERTRNDVLAWQEKVRSARLTAPVTGTLYALPVRVGDFVRAGDLLAEVADLNRVRLRAYVDEPELALLAEGQPVEITWDALPGKTWAGQTDQIPRQVVPRGTRSVGEVLCSIANAGLELLPNVNVNVRILVRQKASALVVPRAAVRGDASRRYVFLVEGDHLRERPVTVGTASADKYEILAGLSPGDRVALPGDVPLRDGLHVRVMEQK